jgi:hypothetical protein
MKKSLLIPPSNLYNSLLKKQLLFLYAVTLLLFFGFTQTTQAQCQQYQVFESFRNAMPISTTLVGPPAGRLTNMNQGSTLPTNPWTGLSLSTTTGTPYSGKYALTFSGSTGYIITPKIPSLKILSFYYRGAPLGSGTAGFTVQYSTNYTGIRADVGTATWTNLASLGGAYASATQTAIPNATPYTFVSYDLTSVNNAGSGGIYIRILNNVGFGSNSVNIDDLAWTSTVDAQNTQVVMPTQKSAGATSCTTVAMPLNGVYTLSDNGGLSDDYDNAPNQDHTVNFTPFPGQIIQMSFPTVTTTLPLVQVTSASALNIGGVGAAASGLLSISNTDNVLTNYNTTNSVPSPAVNYTSTAAGCSGIGTVRFTTNANSTPGSGFVLTVRSISPGSCSDVVTPLANAAAVTSSTIPLTWTALTGCNAPIGGYDYYVSNVNVAPPTGALTPSNTTTLQAANIASGAATGGTVSGLQSDTLFYIWVRSNCSASYGTWTSVTATRTLCSAVASLPYAEDFQSGLTLPSCMTSNSLGNIGIGTVGANNFAGVSGVNTIIISKPLTLTAGVIYRFSFDYGNNTNQATTLQAFYGRTNFNVLSNLPSSSLGTFTTSSSTLTNARTYFQPNTSGTYYVSIRVNTIAGGSLTLDNLNVTVVPCFPAATPTIISGATSSCPGSTVTYTATATGFAGNTTTDGLANATTTATSLSWTLPSGWLLLSQPTLLTASVQTGIIPGNVSASGNLAGCDSSPFTNYAVTSSTIPAQPSTISGLTTICTLPTASLVYSVTNAATSYNWVFPTGWTITAGAGTNSVTVTATGSAVSGTITVTPSNGSCTGTPRTLNVAVGAVSNATCDVATPITSSASDTFRCGTRNFWYLFTVPATCTGPYKINLSGNGGDIDLFIYSGCTGAPGTPSGLLASGESGSATESLTVTLTAGVSYYIRVFEYIPTAGAGGTFTVSATSQAIGTLGAIIGTSSVSCSSVTTTAYSVTAVAGASTYTWTVPSGWTINSGQGTTAISVTSNGTTGGVITVTPSGACGIGLPVTKTIAVGQVQPDSISGPGPILCSPFTSTTYSITPVLGATSYVWTVPSGWGGISTTTSITVSPTATNGNITVAAVGPCGTSAATSLALVTASPVSTINASVCQGSSASMSSTVVPVTSFTMTDIPATGAPTFVRSLGRSFPNPYAASTNTVSYTTITISPTVTGTYVFNGCASGDTFLHIYDGSFNPVSPATNFMASNDDGNGAVCGLDPRITIDLVSGNSYILVYSTFSGTGAVTGINITVTPPSGGGVQFGTTDWYTAASGGSPIFSGNSFNPVTAPGGPFVNNNIVGVTTFYATNSLSSVCRTPTTFTIAAQPTVTIITASSTVCSNSVVAVTVTGTASSYVWSSNVINTLYTDVAGTVSYAGQNITTVYVKTAVTAIITVAGTNPTGCTATSNITLTASASSLKTWAGAGPWSPSAPVAGDNILITGNYPGGSITGCNCTVTGTALFNTGDTVTLAGELNATGGSVTFESGSSLVQSNDVSNFGSITYKRDSAPCWRFDYTYWSSPVASQTLIGLSPFTSSIGFFDYNPNISNWQQTNSASTMNIGKGYLIRVPSFFPMPPPPISTPLNFSAIFNGVPNNGTIPLSVINNAPAQLNLIGNPYPSALSAALLVTDPDYPTTGNSNFLGGTLYFWTHNAFITGGQYPNSYAAWNILGGVGTFGSPITGVGNNSIPNGNIASGQGFFIKTLATGTAYFRNSMRLGGVNNNNFYRTNTASNSDPTDLYEKHRIWLDIYNNENAYKQLLVGYIQGGTDGLDRLFDGEMADTGNTVTLYTTVENKKLSIQGRGLTFSTDDVFPLGYKTSAADTYTINLSNFDGLFTSQNIYLKDKLLSVIHDLKDSPYTFASEAGTFENRFELLFNNQALGVPEYNENTVIVYKNEEGLHIDTGNLSMSSVSIFDVTGRLITTQKGINDTQTKFTTLPMTNQVLLVQITSELGEVVTKKIVY